MKVGDLLHSEHSGGHIGIIIGKDKDYIYVAQALWRMAPISLTKRSDNLNAVQITKYTYKFSVINFVYKLLIFMVYIMRKKKRDF